MKCLEGKSNTIMNKIFEGMTLEDESYRKWDNGGESMMALVAEVILPYGHMEDGREPIELVSLAHYYVQEGDMMRDPEMIFKRVSNPMAKFGKGEESIFFPISFQQDNLAYTGLPTLQESVMFRPDKASNQWKTSYRRAMQADHCEFAEQWLLNANDQQGILEGGTYVSA